MCFYLQIPYNMKILFPTDFSESAQHAFQQALLFADKTGGDIIVLHVVYPIADTGDLPGYAAKIMRDQIGAAEEVMKEFIAGSLSKVERQMQNTPDIESKVKIGLPVMTIKKEASKNKVDLVLMGNKGTHRTYEKVMGTVSAGVLTKVNCPVLIIPETAEIKPFQCIAYATDVNEADPFEIWKTSNLLAPLNAIVRVVHIHDKKESASKFKDFERLKKYFEDHPVSLQMQFHNLSGKNVEKTLLDFMYLYDVDLLVMYRPKRSFIDRLFFKSYTKEMAANTQVPLLVMKD